MAEEYLVTPREQKCIGCKLCVLAAARHENRKISIKDSPITIKGQPGGYKIQLDYGNKMKYHNKIVQICPQNCFDIVRSSS